MPTRLTTSQRRSVSTGIFAALLVLGLATSLFVPFSNESAYAATSKTNVIYDADFYNDVSTLGGLALALGSANRGDTNVLAVTVNKRDSEVAVPAAAIGCTKAVLNEYGVNAPIGITPESNPEKPTTPRNSFANECAAKLTTGTPTTTDAVTVMKNALTSLPAGQKAVIISGGFETNLLALLQSNGGPELIAAKVSQLSVTGGKYGTGIAEEDVFNFHGNPTAAVEVAKAWPTPVVYTGHEIGPGIYSGAVFSDRPATSAIRSAYEAFAKSNGKPETMRQSAPAYEGASALKALYPSVKGLGLSAAGKNKVAAYVQEDASIKVYSDFVVGTGNHRYVTLDDAYATYLGNVIDAISNNQPLPTEPTTTTPTTTTPTEPTTTTPTTKPAPKPENPTPPVASDTNGDGYRVVTANGQVSAFGVRHFGDLTGARLKQPIVGIASTPDDDGYWLVAADGEIFAFGNAENYGSMGGKPLNKPIIGMASTYSGEGYWLVGQDGGIFSFGDADFYGSTGNIVLNKPVVGMTVSGTGKGYYFVASDGGIFSYGDAQFYGSMGDKTLNKPVVGMATTGGPGYWLVASDGGIFSFGDADFYGSTGSIRLNKPVVGMRPTLTGAGYWFVASDGGVFAYGDAKFSGSLGGGTLTGPVVGMS